MQVLLIAGAGAVAGFGLWLGITAVRGVRVLPEARRFVPSEVPANRAVAWLATSLLLGIVVGAATGWPVAGFGAALGLLAGPAAIGGTARRAEEAATADAIATWADMIRDTMAGASGLEESPHPNRDGCTHGHQTATSIFRSAPAASAARHCSG